MTTTAAGDAAVARLNKATEAFEKIITGASNQVVDVPGYGNHPTLAARVDERLDETTATAAAEADRSSTEADRATTQATAAANSVTLATAEYNKAKTQADRAQSEADRASQISGLDTVADAIGLAALPFPDVWIPFTDSLRMFAGYGREVKVGDDVIARYVNFERTTNAWYFDKMGNLRLAAVNEPRFEAEGLLIEGPSTNIFRWDATRIATGGGVQSPVTSLSYQGITAKKVVGGTSFVAIGASKEILKDNTVYSATAIIDLKNSNIPNNKVQLQFAYSANWNNNSIKVDIATLAVVVTPGTTGTARIVGDLLVITATASSSASASSSGGGSIDLYYLDSSGAAAAPPADGSMCVVGFQFEEKPFATSFILTSSSAATRALDKCWMPIDRNSPINTDITMSMEYNMIGGNMGDGEAGSSAWRSICGFYTAGAGFYNWLLVRSDDLKLSYCWGLEGERATVNNNGKGVVVGRVKLGRISIFNSGIKGTDKQGSKNPNHNQSIFAFGNLAIGSGASSAIGDRELYGHLRNFRIWHSAKTDAQCVAIR